jgi:hypothetical protein
MLEGAPVVGSTGQGGGGSGSDALESILRDLGMSWEAVCEGWSTSELTTATCGWSS